MLAAVVGVVCFASGVGVVGALASEDTGAADEAAPETVAGDVTPPAAVAPSAATGIPPAPSPTDAPSPAVDPSPREDAGKASTDVGPAVEPGGAEDVAPASPAKDPPADKWWEGVKTKRCTVLYGDHQRLVVREGSLRRDETTTYGPFADNDVVARVRRENATEVTVHHFGFHPRNGRPSLAHVTVHVPGGDITGILPLQIGEDQIELRPVGGARP